MGCSKKQTAGSSRSLPRTLTGLAVAAVLTLSPPTWLDSEAGLALASDEPLGVTRGTELAAANPMRAMKRLGNKQRSLLNRASRAGKSQGAIRAPGMQARSAYQTRSINQGSAPPGYKGGQGGDLTGDLAGDGRLKSGNSVAYMRLTRQLSGQNCESIEGGVLVRRGC